MKVTQHLAAQVQLLVDPTIGFALHFYIFTEIALHFGIIIMHTTTNEWAIAKEWYSKITSTKSPSLYITTFSANLTYLTTLLPQSHDGSCYVSRQTLAPPPL